MARNALGSWLEISTAGPETVWRPKQWFSMRKSISGDDTKRESILVPASMVDRHPWGRFSEHYSIAKPNLLCPIAIPSRISHSNQPAIREYRRCSKLYARFSSQGEDHSHDWCSIYNSFGVSPISKWPRKRRRLLQRHGYHTLWSTKYSQLQRVSQTLHRTS